MRKSEDSLERKGNKKKERSESFCSLRVPCKGRWIQTPESRVTETSLQVRPQLHIFTIFQHFVSYWTLNIETFCHRCVTLVDSSFLSKF